ncbi:MAG: hypothetical protein R3F29_10650 [Planctomycetota bacterium]
MSGVLLGGHANEHQRGVELWRVEDEPAIAAARAEQQPSWNAKVPWPRSASTPAAASSSRASEPGAWRLVSSRSNLAKTRSSGSDPPQPVGAVPLIDGGADRRQIVDFTITPGATTEVELQEPPLGTLRGRVLLRGAPCADVRVFAVRPDWQPFSARQQLTGERVPADWDDDLTLSWTASTMVDADGVFTFRYRDPGPVELRVRHERGAATQLPIVVELPPPGADVVHDLPFTAGAIRGRFALELLEPRDRQFVKVVLYPPHKATDDPSWHGEWTPALSWSCSKIEFDEQHDGAFAFDYLPDGDWLVRVQEYAFACDPGPLWQRLVTIENGAVVELDAISPTPRVTATLSWRWLEDRAPGSVYGVWLHHAASTPTPQWCGTFPIPDDAQRSPRRPVATRSCRSASLAVALTTTSTAAAWAASPVARSPNPPRSRCTPCARSLPPRSCSPRCRHRRSDPHSAPRYHCAPESTACHPPPSSSCTAGP